MQCRCSFFFFNDTATTEIYTLSLHDALPISITVPAEQQFRTGAFLSQIRCRHRCEWLPGRVSATRGCSANPYKKCRRSEEHTSELQSRQYLVCRLLLEKKKHPQSSAFPSHNV